MYHDNIWKREMSRWDESQREIWRVEGGGGETHTRTLGHLTGG